MINTSTTRHGSRGVSLFVVLIHLLLCAPPVLAQQEASGDSTATVEPPTNWWLRNAATYAPIDRLLWHIEGNYALSLQRGNVEGSAHNGSLRSWLRMGKGTLAVVGGLDYQELSLADGVSEISTRRYRAGATWDYALSGKIAPEVGLFIEHDDAAFIETRQIGYVGVRIIPFSNDRVTATLLPAFGYQHEEAILTGEKRSFVSPYVEESISWQVLERLRFEQSGNVLFSLEQPETWRAILTAGFAVPVVDFLSITLNYELRYNNNPIPTDEALRQVTGGVGAISRDDHDLTAGIRLQY